MCVKRMKTDHKNGLYNCVPDVDLQCGIPADGSCMALGPDRCTREIVVGQKPMIDFYKRKEKIINFNWEYFYAEPGYTGTINGHCNSFHPNWRSENWTVYCDDNNNGVHDEDEDSVTFDTKYDYVPNGDVAPTNFKAMIKHCPYYELEEQLHCGYKKTFVEEFLKEAEDYENRGLQKKAQKECGYIYMGPQFYGSPTKDEWDGETCTSPFMENALWANGTSPGYQTANGQRMAGNILVGGSGLIQQGLGRDHPFALPVVSAQSNWEKKGVVDAYGLHSCHLYNAYTPCWEQIMKIGGARTSTYQYNQMYSLSKGERLFGWETLNLMNEVQESYIFHLRNVEPFGGFFYDISPIDKRLFWKRWDLRRMGEINDYTDRLWRDHKWETHEDVLNTNEVDSINQVGVKVFMGFEGQLGALPQWLDRSYTKCGERPWMANTLKAHKDCDLRSAVTTSSFSYGNKNYQNIAMMNSVTTAQAEAWAAVEPETPYLERVFELYKNSYVGKWTIHHQQMVYDNANGDNEDGTEESFDASGKYPPIDLAELFSRPELQECPGNVEEWASWSNCDRSCGEGIRIRTRGCFDQDGNELGAGWCVENEREIEMCNLRKCDNSIWEAGQKWSDWGPWNTCNEANLNTRNRVCNFESGTCGGLLDGPHSPDESDYEAVFDESCIKLPENNICTRIKMVTQYEHKCPHLTDELKKGFDGTETYNGHPGCPDAPWWWHYRQFFRITGYYDLDEIVDGRPVYTKRAHDIKLKYNADAESWVITNEGVNQLFVVSNAISPDHTNGADWNIRLEKEGYERFIPVWKAEQEPWNIKVEFEFECYEGDGFPVDETLPQATGAQWTGWADRYKYLNSPEDGIINCIDGCGDMRTKERARICSVEDLCVGTTVDLKMCGGNRPETCARQHGECDANGFRAIYWQHFANEGFSNAFKEACYHDHSKCQFGHNPPLKSNNFMNLANLEQFKQQDDSTGFYEFKFEWDERPDKIELFEFESGPSDFSWKQRESPLDVEDVALEVWDIVGHNVKNLTDFRFDGLAWSNDKDLSVMFDGIIDLGVEWVNGMGKQSRNDDWVPNWDIKQPLKRNWNLYSMGTLKDRKYWWSKFMGGWVSESEVMDNTFTNDKGQVIMLGRDMQEILFRSPLKSILKVRDINC